jgi:hypothetical protein
MRPLQPVLFKCQPHLQVVYTVVANEALATESWLYNHNISIGGNVYAQACLEAQSYSPSSRLGTCHEEILILLYFVISNIIKIDVPFEAEACLNVI